MTDLKVELLPWQQEVYSDPTRFKVIAAGRRTGKSRLAAWSLILNCLSAKKGQVFYVAPTQGQARDIMWQMLLELGHSVIASSHVNNLQIKFVNGALLTLTVKERQVIQLVAEGKSNKQVARDLNVTPETIKSHMKNIFAKLKVDNRAQAAVMVQQA